MTPSFLIDHAAKHFTNELVERIGIKNLRKVVELNAIQPTNCICHSHDFCDANQVFLDAFEIKDGSYKEEWTDVVMEIWNHARLVNFYL